MKYSHMGEFGYNLHLLLEKLKNDIDLAKNICAFAHERGVHHRKRELNRIEWQDGALTKRDREVWKLAIAMTQLLIGETYRQHSMGVLEEVHKVPLV